ncbi:GntR family transcriptional regulator, partial [Neptunomonas phycophila]|uniref:GntR family transcriptional regulator n=1 Tax=Neptunomonas phycophila TaxID=1572645 RepID=UPI003516B30A
MTTKSNIRELPVEVITLADSVCAEIVTAIVKGEIPSGQKISEPELARTYGISRGPLREAMRRLEGLRLIERKPHVGARVVHDVDAVERAAAHLYAARARGVELLLKA